MDKYFVVESSQTESEDLSAEGRGGHGPSPSPSPTEQTQWPFQLGFVDKIVPREIPGSIETGTRTRE